MEVVTSNWSRMILPISYHTLPLNPGLYFGLKFLEMTNLHIKKPILSNQHIKPQNVTLSEQKYSAKTRYRLEESSYLSKIQDYLSRNGFKDTVIVTYMLPQREILPRIQQPNSSYLVPRNSTYRSYLTLRREKGFKLNLHCPFPYSHKLSDHKKKSRLRCHRGPRRLTNILNIDRFWA